MADMNNDNHQFTTKPNNMPDGSFMPISGGGGHQMEDDDPDNPQNWPFLKKAHASSVATFFVFYLLFGLTSYADAVQGVVKEFNVSMTYAVAPFSLYLAGIAFAPLYTPHLSEKFGRRYIYFVGTFIGAWFLFGAGRAKSIGTLCACRFLAGFFAGPSVVLIEGTYADVWSPSKTLTYYSMLTWASYLGATTSPLVLGYIVEVESWRYTQYVSCMFALAALLFGFGMPETYPREIMRQRARRNKQTIHLEPAASGTTILEMARHTVINPAIMLVSEPVVMLFSLQVMLVFGTVFQWFVSVPVVLTMVFKFTPGEIGLALIASIGAIPFSVVTCAAIEAWAYPRAVAKSGRKDMIDIEYRLLPAFLGGIIQGSAMFWIGWTATPQNHAYTPIIGTWFFVWGNLITLISYVSYIFDAYPPQGTLSALTAGAVMRVLFAAATPLFILQMITKLGGGPTYSIWGAILFAFIGITVVLYLFGAKMRMRSRYGPKNTGYQDHMMAENKITPQSSENLEHGHMNA